MEKSVKFEILEHVADGKFRAYGKNLNTAFSNAALAMFSLMTDIKKVKGKTKKKITIEGVDLKSLLYKFLEELLFLFDSKGFLLKDVKNLKIKGNKLTAEIIGDKAKNYEIFGDVKAVTYSQMKITDKYVQVVVDM